MYSMVDWNMHLGSSYGLQYHNVVIPVPMSQVPFPLTWRGSTRTYVSRLSLFQYSGRMGLRITDFVHQILLVHKGDGGFGGEESRNCWR